MGAASLIYAQLETRARNALCAAVRTEASRISRSFFAKHGFAVEAAETAIRGNVEFERFRMVKTLEQGACQAKKKQPYSINLDVRFAPLELIDVEALAGACKIPWFNQTLCKVNDCVVRMGVMKGEFHWHKHDKEDEFFFVIDGRFIIELEGRTVELGKNQGFTVPRGVMHRPRSPEGSVILMFEGKGVSPQGD